MAKIGENLQWNKKVLGAVSAKGGLSRWDGPRSQLCACRLQDCEMTGAINCGRSLPRSRNNTNECVELAGDEINDDVSLGRSLH